MKITRTTPSGTRSNRAVTLVEVLVVTLILGIILAIAIPLYESSRRHSHRKACEANLIAIYQAEEAYRVRNRVYVAGKYASGWAQITQMLGGAPRCPAWRNAGSEYDASITGGTVTITCGEVGAHTAGTMLAYSNGTVTEINP